MIRVWDRPDRKSPPESIGHARNLPCACGSGRKAKKCEPTHQDRKPALVPTRGDQHFGGTVLPVSRAPRVIDAGSSALTDAIYQALLRRESGVRVIEATPGARVLVVREDGK